MTLRDVHDFELALLDPVLAMSERGVRIDGARRLAMLKELDESRAPLAAEARELVVSSLLLDRLDGKKRVSKPHLFRERWVCPCCRNGKAKRVACWSCAGFAKKPTKKMLTVRIAEEGKGAEAVATYVPLAPCLKCDGAGQRDTLTFNPDSPEQVKIVLYEVLRLPKRVKDGKLRSDEEALRELAGEDTSGLCVRLLRIAKCGTMAEILTRIAPGPDGRIRTFYNPAGTETGRFSSSESFLLRSTNLQNMPKREATEDGFDVRACFVPDDGQVFVETDLSGAEAWITAACCEDTTLLEWLRAGADVHRLTAAHIFRKEAADVTTTERHLGKVARHALNYGMQAVTFRRNVNADTHRTGVRLSRGDADAIVAEYHRLHPGLQHWWRSVADELGRTGRLRTCFGRVRTFFGRNRGAWLGETHREAIAFEPQSTIADLLNRGLLRWWRQHDGKVGQLLLQVHDAVIIQVSRERVALARRLLERCLTEEIEVHGHRITIPVTIQTGDSWAASKPDGGLKAATNDDVQNASA